MMLQVHIDVMIVTGSSAHYTHYHKHQKKRFLINDSGDLTHYTDCNFKLNRQNNPISFSQEAYIDRLLELFTSFESSPLPATPHANAPRKKEQQPTKKPYKEALGTLMCLPNMSRLEIANAVRSVARRSHGTTQADTKGMTKILAYLWGTKDLRFKLTGHGGQLLFM